MLMRACFLRLAFIGVMSIAALSASGAEDKAPGTQPAGTWSMGTPITTYWAGPALTDAAATQMSEGGFNLVWSSEKELDVARGHKLRALLNDPLIAPATLDDPAKRQELDALIDRVKKHPAMYAYFITDEPGAAAFPGLGRLVAYLRERDPAHFAYINLFPTYANNEQLGTKGDTVTAYREHLRQYMETVKPALVSWDHYQFAIGGKDNDQYFLNMAMIRQVSMQAGVPFLNIVQACTWAPEAMRAPKPDELRFLVYTTLAYGAQGISYFVYSWPGTYKPGVGQLITPEGKPTELYDAVKKLNPEFVAIASELQKLRSVGVYHAGMMPPGGEPLPEGLPFRLDPPIEKQEYKAPAPIKGILMGTFGSATTGTSPTHAVIVNLDYAAEHVVGLTAAKPMEVYTPGKGWGAGEKHVSLKLPRGGGVLIRHRP